MEEQGMITEKELESLGFGVDSQIAYICFNDKDTPSHLHWKCTYFRQTHVLDFYGYEYGVLFLRHVCYIQQIKQAFKLMGVDITKLKEK